MIRFDPFRQREPATHTDVWELSRQLDQIAAMLRNGGDALRPAKTTTSPGRSEAGASEIGGSPASTTDWPRRWRRKLDPGTKVCGRTPEYFYGCYYPTTDLNTGESGGRGTGAPTDVEWLDPQGG